MSSCTDRFVHTFMHNTDRPRSVHTYTATSACLLTDQSNTQSLQSCAFFPSNNSWNNNCSHRVRPLWLCTVSKASTVCLPVFHSPCKPQGMFSLTYKIFFPWLYICACPLYFVLWPVVSLSTIPTQIQRALWDFTEKNCWNNTTRPQSVSITGEILLPGRPLIGVRWEGAGWVRVRRESKEEKDNRKAKCVGGISGGHLGFSPEGKIVQR